MEGRAMADQPVFCISSPSHFQPRASSTFIPRRYCVSVSGCWRGIFRGAQAPSVGIALRSPPCATNHSKECPARVAPPAEVLHGFLRRRPQALLLRGWPSGTHVWVLAEAVRQALFGPVTRVPLARGLRELRAVRYFAGAVQLRCPSLNSCSFMSCAPHSCAYRVYPANTSSSTILLLKCLDLMYDIMCRPSWRIAQIQHGIVSISFNESKVKQRRD
ncbi:hypothetical protein BC834DRAFT_501764 [Gloeopeniophorella convolvens]|nr:hypothetical protein BC834DRAFT_501764 [Gloeopeniophorella convolvens]